MHDMIIKNGTIIDGTGADRFEADIAIKNGKIVSVGELVGAAHQEIDARGKLVTPGWVDVHTHYDGQATWEFSSSGGRQASIRPSYHFFEREFLRHSRLTLRFFTALRGEAL